MSMERTPIEDLNETIQADAVAATRLRESNHRILEKIEHFGGGVDLSMARIEHFITYLVEQRVISEAMAWEEQLGWERHLRPQLQNNLQVIQALAAEAQRKAARPKLIVPGR